MLYEPEAGGVNCKKKIKEAERSDIHKSSIFILQLFEASRNMGPKADNIVQVIYFVFFIQPYELRIHRAANC